MDRRLFFLLALASVFVSADATASTDLAQADTSVQGLLDLVLQQSHQWSGKLYDYAIRLFWLLASIQFIWTFMPLVMKQADFGEIVGELLRFVLVIGFFLAVMKYSVEWSTAIVDSFRDAAASASGLGRALEPGDMLAVALDFGRTMVKGISVFSPAKGLLIAVCAILVLACFAFIAAFMFVTLVESYVIINASVLFLGFGGSQWTRDFAIAPMRFTVAIGAKLFVLTLIVGLIVQSAKQWLAAYTNDEASLMTMVGLALVCCYLTKTIPDVIGGMISGTSMGGGSAIGGMAVAGAAGAAAAMATIATAGAAAPAAAGTLSAAGAGTGVTGASGSLASAINSSFAGASSAGEVASSAGGMASSASVGTSTGGSAAAKGASTAGSRVGGGTANTAPSPSLSQPSSSVQQAVKHAGKSAQGNDDKEQPTTPKGGATGSNNTLSQAASGAAKMLGVMASMSVPGMENAHALHPGSGSPAPLPEGNGSVSPTNEVEFAAKSTLEESNVIRPASDTSPTPDRLATLQLPGMTSNNQSENQP